MIINKDLRISSKKIEEILWNELLSHPLYNSINKFVDYNERLCYPIARGFLIRSLTYDIISSLKDLVINENLNDFKKDLVNKVRANLDGFNNELSTNSEECLIISFEDLQKDSENIYTLEMYQVFKILLHYLNLWGLVKEFKSKYPKENIRLICEDYIMKYLTEIITDVDENESSFEKVIYLLDRFKILVKEEESKRWCLENEFAYPFEDDSCFADYKENLRTFSEEELRLIERKKKKLKNKDKIKLNKKNRKD